MNWTTQTDLRDQVQRIWDRGELLRACVTETVAWPLRLTLKIPTTADLTDRFEAVRDWSNDVTRVPHVRFDWRDWAHRVQGKQRLPTAVWIDTLRDALAMIGQVGEAQCYETLWQQTSVEQPALLPWLIKRPHQVLELADCWDRLLAVVAWMLVHPRPGVYLRQVDAPGVDSKFIEAHRSVLIEWLDLILPSEVRNATATGVAQFARRYGFLEKPDRLRFRVLDSGILNLPGCQGLPDVTLDSASFAALTLPGPRVFITENEVNFLAFPPLMKAIVIFGAGYGWEALSCADWLKRCDLYYWGDIDTHGFAILNQLRCYFPHTTSFLMDRETLLAHRSHWGEESQPARHDLPYLTPEETSIYDELRFDRIQFRLRLEQERIGYGWLEDKLKRI